MTGEKQISGFCIYENKKHRIYQPWFVRNWMSTVLFFMIVCGTVYGACAGKLEAVASAALSAGQDALETAVSLMGGFIFFGGVTGILEKAGAVAWMRKRLQAPLRWLFGGDATPEALEAITMNLSANMLGLSNAATPMGMRAAKLLTPPGARTPSAALCMLLVINATSVQLLPTSVIALRSAAGSLHPDSVVWPSLAASTVSTLAGILLCRLLEGKKP